MHTNKKLVILALTSAVILAVTLAVFLVIRPQTDKVTSFTDPVESETEITPVLSESESVYYHFETDETDIIRDIKIIPIGE